MPLTARRIGSIIAEQTLISQKIKNLPMFLIALVVAYPLCGLLIALIKTKYLLNTNPKELEPAEHYMLAFIFPSVIINCVFNNYQYLLNSFREELLFEYPEGSGLAPLTIESLMRYTGSNRQQWLILYIVLCSSFWPLHCTFEYLNASIKICESPKKFYRSFLAE